MVSDFSIVEPKCSALAKVAKHYNFVLVKNNGNGRFLPGMFFIFKPVFKDFCQHVDVGRFVLAADMVVNGSQSHLAGDMIAQCEEELLWLVTESSMLTWANDDVHPFVFIRPQHTYADNIFYKKSIEEIEVMADLVDG